MHEYKEEILLQCWGSGFTTLQTMELLLINGHSSTPTEITDYFAKRDSDYTECCKGESNYNPLQPFG
jgi:hypothetical protein